jgi:hypothetical protein
LLKLRMDSLGQKELVDNWPEEADRSWRRSLELSDGYLTRILDECASQIASEAILQKIVPIGPVSSWQRRCTCIWLADVVFLP